LLLGVPIAVVVFVLLRTDTPRAVPNESAVRFQHQAWPGTTIASSGMLAPDGRHLAFTARDDRDGRIRLWVRSLDSSVSRALPATEGAFRPFWSPDGQAIAFFADGRLKKVGLDGAPPQTLATVGYRPSGGTWSGEGVLLYADRMSRIYSVSEAGDGKVTPLTTLDEGRQEVAHYAPQFLPDGRHFLFVVDSLSPDYRGTFVASLDDPSARNRLLDGGAVGATFAPPDHLVYVRDQTLMAQPFDAARLRLAGTPTSLGSSVASRSASISAAPGGLLTFGGDTTAEHLVWFDRSGQQQGVLPTTILHNPRLSPDERQIVGDNGGIWLLDLERGAPTRIADGTLPGWTADGDGVVFTRRTKDAPTIVVQAIAGESDERVLVRSPEMKLTGGWSRDGRYFFYVGSDPETRLDLWRLGASEDQPQPFLKTAANEMQPALSPDGNWIAYTSDETGAWEVYVQSFPMPGGKRAISVGGGAEPQWTRNGHEIVYLRPDGTMMAVDVTPGDAALQPGRPRPLFRTSIAGDITTYRNHYVVTADGQRFLVNMGDESTREPINVVVHWQALLNR
jgi:Tol biopolymer transport system component